jgi:hypothetical protein
VSRVSNRDSRPWRGALGSGAAAVYERTHRPLFVIASEAKHSTAMLSVASRLSEAVLGFDYTAVVVFASSE